MKKECPNCGHKVEPKDGKCPDCGAEMKATEEEGLQEGTLVSPADLSPLIEAAEVIIPKKGKLFEEKTIEGGHTVKVAKFAIIRPCQSKGRAIRGLQPIYEPKMLSEHAAVFTGWPMYLDHMSEELAEAISQFLQERGRSIKDLGGRVLRSFYDPTVTMESDEENGYRKGAVVGEIVPQKIVREMLEEDPLALAVSINAWPTKARVGTASWNSSLKGAVIEGIRSKPMGSVDFVPRGGAGGRILSEEEIAREVSLLESAYTAARDDEQPTRKERPVKKKLSEMSEKEIAALTPEGLAEALREENPTLAESLAEGNGNGNGNGASTDKPLTQADLDRALNEQRTALVEEFGSTEEAAEEMVEERMEYRELAEHAKSEINKLQKAGLPAEYCAEIAKNYIVVNGQPRAGLAVQEREGEDGATLSKKEVITESIKADALTACRLIEAAGGTPRVKGLGPSGKNDDDADDGGGKEKKKTLREGTALYDFMRESGDISGDPEKDGKKLTEVFGG